MNKITIEQFLDTWEPSRHLEHATLDSNLFDPLAQARLYNDFEGVGEVPRNIKELKTYNKMPPEEELYRHLNFFRSNQKIWATEFFERLIDSQVRKNRLNIFIKSMAEHWVDGSKRRQDAPEMRALKASIRLHDQKKHKAHAGKFVIHADVDVSNPLFSAEEMGEIFEINSCMLETHMATYLSTLFGEQSGSINWLYVRRGVCMPHKPKSELEELHYLSSYSLSVGAAELFAQTQGKTKCNGQQCIFSAPLPAIQQRVVAFAPFIRGMEINQMEFVVAPPIRSTPLTHRGDFGAPPARISDYDFN